MPSAVALADKYAAFGLAKTRSASERCRDRKKPQSYGTLSSLCPSPVMLSARSKPAVQSLIGA